MLPVVLSVVNWDSPETFRPAREAKPALTEEPTPTLPVVPKVLKEAVWETLSLVKEVASVTIKELPIETLPATDNDEPIPRKPEM